MPNLKIECVAGEAIADCCRAAQYIADQLRITVEFQFNSVKCLASPGGDGDLLAERYTSEAQRKPSDIRDVFRVARSRP